MFDWLSGIAQSLGTLASNIVSGIRDALAPLFDGVVSGIREIFVPDEDFVTERWNSIRERFSFVDSISETADIIIRFFKDTIFDEPPKIYINLGNAESKYDYGSSAYCLDMTWYARYKPIVDPFLSGWIWLCFIYRVYTKLPSIIGGVAGDFHTVGQTLDQWKGGKK